MAHTAQRYQIVEIDANDRSQVLRSGLTQGEARAKLKMLRETYCQPALQLRYIMRRESSDYMTLPSARGIEMGL